ncbi:phosphoribosyltransferase [Mesorhizobium sp. ESP-6-4]|uniref:phosphoribosyltransferase family protein n=1 Tax=Mesorhizobium sp. ESP-6-4 TaxID=2876624 RepID=UPI001CCE8212|nr:phosphoribosyltransferase family protein [Mesorhizobium sp. ESP-6-4]MBZ9659786.1 phosphoribosyltransferase [Mesorhizobium sp. ESP-6-4]
MLSVRSFADLNRTIADNLHRLDRDKFDCVVGIPRSGMIPAALIATSLQKPLADVDGYARGLVAGRSGVQERAGQRVLLVDDSANKGRAMAAAVARIAHQASEITRLAVFGPYQVEPATVCDMFFECVHGPRAFQWNMMKHIRLDRWCFDFDGVLCRDPTKEENDDGPAYEKFLANAEPLFLPTRPIGHIVTGRLEKYRGATDAWLKRHGVSYTSMTMMPYSTKAERLAAGGRGQWKAEQFKRIGAEFFIESDPKQAGIIARESGLPVWCTRTQSLA